MIAGVSFGGIPIQWDVRVGYDQRFNESSPVAYNITAMRGETLDLMPRYMASGYPFSIASNADVRIYLREYGTTNAFTVSATSGTVYTTSSQLGRVRAVLLPSDIPATNTNQFFVGVESSGMVYRAYGRLTILDSPGVIASTNQIQRGVFDSSVFTFANSHLAPWLLLSDIGNYCGVQSVNGLTGVVSITAASLGALTNVPPQSYTIITNAPWAYETNTASITITNGLASTDYVDSAIASVPQSDPFIVRDTADTNRWWRFEGTNAVQYELGAAATNYTVTLSEDFMETVGGTRPAWTNNVWPFTDGDWEGIAIPGTGNIISYKNYQSSWGGFEYYPALLTPGTDSQGTATVYQHIYYPTNATGNTLGPIPTNLVTDADLAAWWQDTEATKLDAQEFEDHVTPAITPDPHAGVYLLRAYTNAVPVAGNTLLTMDGTNLTVTGETFAYRAFPTNAYRLGISPTAPAFHYGGTIIGTNAVTFADNLLLRGTATVSGTNCFALQPWTNGLWEVLWGAK